MRGVSAGDTSACSLLPGGSWLSLPVIVAVNVGKFNS